MREIKFRCWDSDRNKMWVLEGTKKGEYRDGDGTNWFPLRELASPSSYYTFMQYTGLKDKNGKEIYEGDIAKYEGYYSGYTCEKCNYSKKKDAIIIIKWSKEKTCFIYEIVGKWDEFPFTAWDGDEKTNKKIEVIGNIYENKEAIR